MNSNVTILETSSARGCQASYETGKISCSQDPSSNINNNILLGRFIKNVHAFLQAPLIFSS